ncbi:DeoR/GlpR family DNA-binding transcription regulator [Oceanispirochaeta sp.]|uniref:DeoR/GlpR family DNA-binding transcription regulator n=1 Tax=Oceanispirochaeta sp. TaxID=2035350 RepID=UPI002623E10C|nr:DeoR/GlpR family DNA-binding transcription regulator [Oceanispirochaeta sp.]MDA3956864.1 DeoR/GlpR family DNA-binding transcription regulator [Oceanispirochaeta sp.]
MSEKQLQAERHQLILGILDEESSAQVDELSRRFEVSKNTIRRDLNILEELGFLIRSKGGAVKSRTQQSPRSFDERQILNRSCKKSIARKAAELILEGETIILASGTSTLELAGYLKNRDHLTVITNSLDIAQVLSDEKRLTLILCGGIYDSQSRSMIGMPAELFFRDIHVDKLFMAVKALDEEGIYDMNMKETPVKQSMIRTAEELVVLADHTKIGKKSLNRIEPLFRIDSIICDVLPPEHLLVSFRSAGIDIIVSSEE